MASSSTSAISRLRHAATSGSEFNSSSLLQTRAEDSVSVLKAVAGFEGVVKNSSKRLFYNTQLGVEETGEEEFDDCNFHQPEKKRRLTAEQVHFLEKSFEVDNKLEPERKTQLARDLGLQPRQVAVWFQNRRARWKSKQLEKEYDVLKSSYDTLKTNYDNLLKEKEKLRAEVICLTDKLHAKEKGLEILTKDVEEKSDKVLMDTKSQLQNSAKSEVVSNEMIAPLDSQLLRCRFEDPLSSGTDGSAVLDEDSPHQIDSGHSSAVGYVSSTRFSPFEANLSDFSHVEEEEESICRKLFHHPREQHILKIEEGILPEASTTACTFAFSMEDQENLWWNWAQVFHPSTEHEHEHWHASS